MKKLRIKLLLLVYYVNLVYNRWKTTFDHNGLCAMLIYMRGQDLLDFDTYHSLKEMVEADVVWCNTRDKGGFSYMRSLTSGYYEKPEDRKAMFKQLVRRLW